MFIYLITIIAFLALSITYIKIALHNFQQNRYEFERYTKWLMQAKNYRIKYYFIYVVLAFIVDALYRFLFERNDGVAIIILTILFAIYLIQVESKKNYIKPLVYTARVKRQIVCIAILDGLMVTILSLFFKKNLFIMAVMVPVLSWILVYPMALIMLPIENYIKQQFENEARNILNGMPFLTKVGITGSFGKTSTKNIVENILGESYYTLMTPASFNTPMGITRTVREYLKPIHEVFVVEMGADHVNDIKYLMDFVKPQYGIVTSIGPQHLNTFHSLENIINEKMQMIEMLPSDGLGVINLDNEYIASYKIKNNVKVVSVGIKNQNADFVAYDINYHLEGSSFKVRHLDEVYDFDTCLLGEHNIMNILTGIALAYHMGITLDKIKTSVSKIRRIEHRLELKKINGFTFIDNAFNSNPVGCKLSLDVISQMNPRRVIVTPGLIDLGDKEYAYNKEFGAYMKGRVDDVILVGRLQTKAIVDGLKESGFDEAHIIVKDSVKEAFAYIYQNFTYSDTILLENDLPDAFSK